MASRWEWVWAWLQHWPPSLWPTVRCVESSGWAGFGCEILGVVGYMGIYIYMEIETFWESSEPVIFVGTGDSPRVGLDFEPKIHPIHCWDNPVNKKSVCVYCILFRFTGKGLWSWAIPQVNEQLARKKLKQMHKANDDEPDLCSCFVDETIRATEQTPAIGSTPGIDIGIQKL